MLKSSAFFAVIFVGVAILAVSATHRTRASVPALQRMQIAVSPTAKR